MKNIKKRGFASMSTKKVKEIAARGGRAAHLKGTAHEFTSEEGRLAGIKGGKLSWKKRNAK
jgi:general stress protein YciG